MCWIAALFVDSEVFISIRNWTFLGFYLIQLVFLVRNSIFLKRPAFALMAIVGIVTSLVGGYLMYTFQPAGEITFTIGQGIIALSYTLWLALKKHKVPIDLLKYFWVVGLCLSLADRIYDFIAGPWLDIFWFTAFAVVAFTNSKKKLKKVQKKAD